MAMHKKYALPFALLTLALQVQAQEQLPTVSISGRNANAPVSLGGFGDTPAARLPLQALRIDAERLQELGLDGLAALPKLDASVSDSYNSIGYYTQLRVRGYELDTRFNLRREGLPINGETGLDLFNKAALELIKGSSGLQAGTSAPGGLLNLVVKRPDADRLDLNLSWEQHNSRALALDWAKRFSPEFGLRVNLAAAELDPWLHNSRGRQHGLALAGDWRLGADTLLEAELESSQRSQPSQPGFSLLGGRLPSIDTVDIRRNLNEANWRLPVVLENDFASLRLRQRLNADWNLLLQAGVQRARNDDRVAFPFGCSSEDDYSRYCSDGSFDLYDFRSENELRSTDALRAAVDGRVQLGGLTHRLRAEALVSRYEARFQRQAYNWVGYGSVFQVNPTPADPSLTDENTHRDERSRELALSDQVQIGALELFAGLRHSRIQREAVRTDGSRATSYSQSFTTPWLGASWALAPDLRVYASWGQGIESEVIPNRSRYQNAGRALPALKSRQVEAGLKAGSQTVEWSLAAFQIQRPVWVDLGSCSAANSCERRADGEARHRGVEAQADFKWQGGGLMGSAQWLQARREGSSQVGVNDLRPVNVPARSYRIGLHQQVLDGLRLQANLVHEGRRAVLPDNSIELPSWTRLDLSARYQHAVGTQQRTWQLGVDNASNQRAWKEAPYSFGHSYLFPLAPRVWKAGLSVAL